MVTRQIDQDKEIKAAGATSAAGGKTRLELKQRAFPHRTEQKTCKDSGKKNPNDPAIRTGGTSRNQVWTEFDIDGTSSSSTESQIKRRKIRANTGQTAREKDNGVRKRQAAAGPMWVLQAADGSRQPISISHLRPDAASPRPELWNVWNAAYE